MSEAKSRFRKSVARINILNSAFGTSASPKGNGGCKPQLSNRDSIESEDGVGVGVDRGSDIAGAMEVAGGDKHSRKSAFSPGGSTDRDSSVNGNGGYKDVDLNDAPSIMRKSKR